MKNTKFQAVIMAGAMAASALSSVSVFAEQTTSEAETESVVESKEEVIASKTPCIVARGRKGGSNVAAAICNALLYQASGRVL